MTKTGSGSAQESSAASEDTLRDVLGGTGWDITSLEPATLPGELDAAQVEMAFWYLRAERRQAA
jgi:hypothetical protein